MTTNTISDIRVPSVVKDYNSKTAIVIRKGKKYVYLVAMKSGKLTVSKQTFGQFERSGYKELSYMPLDTVLSKYLAHSGGLTDTARKELESIKETVV